MGEVCPPPPTLSSSASACFLKEPFMTGKKDQRKTSDSGPREQLCFLRSEDCETSEMSGASPKHTKSRGHKACANSCHGEGTGNLDGWANLGQKRGCPETYSPDSCFSQSLNLTDVQTTPSTGGQGIATQPQMGRREEAAQWPAAGTLRTS